ncbi:hypothetical protein C8R45DRAFT_931938 [Mycena sanguinolenta]|nr:hypothetical protein C8R45DRAFT_931938 [Mycena sanguinolenta]
MGINLSLSISDPATQGLDAVHDSRGINLSHIVLQNRIDLMTQEDEILARRGTGTTHGEMFFSLPSVDIPNATLKNVEMKMCTGLMPFHDLNEDVLTQTLLLSDIYSILSFSRVNKSFRRLALSKHLWFSLVVDLSSRYLIPNGHAIHDCTTSQLIAKVKYLMCGPETWSQRSSVPPTVSFSKTFPPVKNGHVLPGGRYFAGRLGSDNLQCYDILTGREVWSHTLKNWITLWAIEMLHDGHTAIFLFYDFNPKHEFSIVQVDLTTGISDELSHLEFYARIGGNFDHPIISGDFLALGLTGMEYDRKIMVVNWRKREYVILASKHSDALPNNYVVFVPGHIIVAAVAHEPPHELRIVAYPLRSFASRWRSLDEFTDLPPPEIRIDPEDMSPIMVERLEHNNRMFTVSPSRGPYSRMVMTVYANPIRDNAYKLMVHALPSGRKQGNQSFGGTAGRPVLFNYALNVGADVFSWKKISSFTTVADVIFPLSYAGYAVVSTFHDGVITVSRIVDPRLTDRFLARWTGQAMREVMVVSKQSAAARLSSSGVVLVSKRDQVETKPRTSVMMSEASWLRGPPVFIAKLCCENQTWGKRRTMEHQPRPHQLIKNCRAGIESAVVCSRSWSWPPVRLGVEPLLSCSNFFPQAGAGTISPAPGSRLSRITTIELQLQRERDGGCALTLGLGIMRLWFLVLSQAQEEASTDDQKHTQARRVVLSPFGVQTLNVSDIDYKTSRKLYLQCQFILEHFNHSFRIFRTEFICLSNTANLMAEIPKRDENGHGLTGPQPLASAILLHLSAPEARDNQTLQKGWTNTGRRWPVPRLVKALLPRFWCMYGMKECEAIRPFGSDPDCVTFVTRLHTSAQLAPTTLA